MIEPFDEYNNPEEYLQVQPSPATNTESEILAFLEKVFALVSNPLTSSPRFVLRRWTKLKSIQSTTNYGQVIVFSPIGSEGIEYLNESNVGEIFSPEGATRAGFYRLIVEVFQQNQALNDLTPEIKAALILELQSTPSDFVHVFTNYCGVIVGGGDATT